MTKLIRLRLLACLCCCVHPLLCDAKPSRAAEKPNVLFLVADDLRVELGCYGSSARSPNLDRLAARGVLFEHAYCQQALCNPSRSSFLTGLRPNSTGIDCNNVHFRDRRPDVVTLPQAFLKAGYATRNCGKIFHNWHTAVHGDRGSWSAPEFLHYASHGDDKPQVDGEPPPNLATLNGRAYQGMAAKLTECRDVPDAAYYDGRVADEAVRVLDEIKAGPFFLAVGFWKPHAPMNAPAKYWNLFRREQFPPIDGSRPQGAPEIAFHDGRELRGLPPNQTTFDPAQIAEIRHGYWANIAYMDAQLGKVLDALDRSGKADSTIVVFLADHGFHLGEHGLWAKTSNFELDARVPLIIAAPGRAARGGRAAAPVELLDLYPTLAELCGLAAPQDLEGRSLVPLLDDPTKSVKPAAFTQHPRPAYYDRTPAGVPEQVGYSVRTPRVRYTEWRDWKTGRVTARELYDHTVDPQEMQNTVDAPADRASLEEAERLLHAQFPPSVPPCDAIRKS